MFVRRATVILVACLVAGAHSAGSSTERSSNKLDADDTTSQTSIKHDLEDNVADSSVSSYSSVVIHHTTGKSKDGEKEDQEKSASRSESYFKIHNLHGKSGHTRVRDDKTYRRPYSPTPVAPTLPSFSSSTSSFPSQHEPKNHRTEPVRTKLRDVTHDNYKPSYPKIKHFESDFKPIEGPTTEEPRRPQRLVNHGYNPHHHESSEEDNDSSSLAGSQEIYRKEPKYRDPEPSSAEVYHSSEHYHSAEDSSPKYYKGHKDDKKHLTSFRTEEYRKPVHGGNYKHYSDSSSQKFPDYSTIYKHVDTPSQRNPEFSMNYKHGDSPSQINPEYSTNYKHGDSSSHRNPDYSTNYKHGDSSSHRNPDYSANYKHGDSSNQRNPDFSTNYKHGDSSSQRNPDYSSNYKGSDSSRTRGSDYSTIYKTPHPRATPTPPPGMSEELMETLLQQEPQKFSDGEKGKNIYPSKKKFKSAGGDSPTSFNVGYSIGFGNGHSDDVVFGKPKDQGLKIHVNGEKSIWKQLNNGVEMSHSFDKTKPLQIRVPDATPRPKINVLKNGGSAVYYMNNQSPDIDTVPTAGKSSFDHNGVLANSNLFDFSNAMPGPIALPLQSNLAPEIIHQPFSLKPKAGRNLDIMSLYQSMGYSPPIPVLIPNGPKGEAQMVHAIVIPLQNIPNVDLGWGQLSGMFAAPGLVAGSAHQPVHFAPAVPMVPTGPATQSNSVHHNSIHSSPSFKSPSSHSSSHSSHSSSHSSHHPISNPFPAIPEKVRIPKYRKAKDAFKSGSFSSPIVVHPVSQSDKKELQKELNAILAQEMSRKNHRHPPLGLRPPPPQ